MIGRLVGQLVAGAVEAAALVVLCRLFYRWGYSDALSTPARRHYQR